MTDFDSIKSPSVPVGQEAPLEPVTPEKSKEVMDAYLAGFADTSKLTMRYALRRIADGLNFPETDPIELLPWHTMTAAEFARVMSTWPADGLAKATIQLYMHAMRGLFRAYFIRNMITARQYLLLKELKIPKGTNRVGRGRSVERTYRDRLLANCELDERPHGIRDAALIAVFFGSGMRRAEVANILIENLRLSEGEVIVKVKGGDTVVKYLAAWSVPYIQKWLEFRTAKNPRMKGPLFCRMSKAGKTGELPLTGRGLLFLLEERSKKAALPFIVRPHDARRTIGTMVIEEEGELIGQRVLGHANLSTTKKYDKRSDAVVKRLMRDAK